MLFINGTLSLVRDNARVIGSGFVSYMFTFSDALFVDVIGRFEDIILVHMQINSELKR